MVSQNAKDFDSPHPKEIHCKLFNKESSRRTGPNTTIKTRNNASSPLGAGHPHIHILSKHLRTHQKLKLNIIFYNTAAANVRTVFVAPSIHWKPNLNRVFDHTAPRFKDLNLPFFFTPQHTFSMRTVMLSRVITKKIYTSSKV